MAAGGDAARSGEGSIADGRFLHLLEIARDRKRKKQQGAMKVLQSLETRLVSDAPRGAGIVSTDDKQRHQAMLSNICAKGVGGLQNQSSSSTVIISQGGREMVVTEGLLVRDQKVSQNFHVICPGVESLKKNETLSYKVCKNGDHYDFVHPSTAGQPSNVSATVCIFDTNVDLYESTSRPQESDLYYNLSQVPSGTFQIQSVLLCKLADSSYNLPKGTLLVYSIELYAGVKDCNFEVPKFLIRKKFASIKDKFPGVVLETPSSKQEKFQNTKQGFFEELPAHAHCLRMFEDPENRVWYEVSIFIDLCDFKKIDLNSDKTFKPLQQVFETLKIDASLCLKIENLYAKADQVVVPLACFNKLPGDNQYCCRSDTFFSCIKEYGVKYSSDFTLLCSMFRSKSPQINCYTTFQNVPVSQLKNKLKEAFMIETPKDMFSCGTLASQLQKASHDKQTSLPARAVETLCAAALHEAYTEMPICLSAVEKTIVFEGICGDDLPAIDDAYMHEAICSGSGIAIADFVFGKPDLSATSSTEDIIQNMLETVFLKKDSFSFDEFLVFVLHMVLDFKGDGNFSRFINIFDNVFIDKMDKFQVSAECTDEHLQRMSHLYFISSMLGGMLATCDLLLVNENRVITFFPSDEFRKHSFSNLDDDVFLFLWNQYANTPGTSSFSSKNLNAAAPHYTFGLLDWVCYFATCQLTRDGRDLDLKTYTADDVKDLATKFVKGIADFNANTYINHGDDRKIPSQPLSASLQNFCMTLGVYIQTLPAGKFDPNIYEVKSNVAEAEVVGGE